MKSKIVLIILGFICAYQTVSSQSDDTDSIEVSNLHCGSNEKIYTDFDFVLGDWNFYTTDGKMIGEQTYTKREQGCLIVEEWKLISGGTGFGMSFVDPKTGLWRQVWMSPRFHIDYSGGLNEKGDMVLEGIIYPNNGDDSSPVRGIWSKQKDGSIQQEFLVLNKKTNDWEILFAGFTRLKSE